MSAPTTGRKKRDDAKTAAKKVLKESEASRWKKSKGFFKKLSKILKGGGGGWDFQEVQYCDSP